MPSRTSGDDAVRGYGGRRRDQAVQNKAVSVLVCDSAAERFQKLMRCVGQCGGEPISCDSNSPIPENAQIALVNLGRTETEIPGKAEEDRLTLIRRLSASGVRVICYEDGCASWRLWNRCLPLAAGAIELLDSASRRFASEIQRTLARLIIEDAQTNLEGHALRDVMGAMDLAGQSPALMRVLRTVLRISRLSDLPVLITGETGTGKERVARAIHRLDPKRCDHPFVAVNCGAVSASLAESELFGHRRGAFTGADRDRKGLIRTAEGGVLFLDEIGELDLSLQAKLLRVLQECRVLGVGEEKEVTVNVRILAATNRDLKSMTLTGQFRPDLFHRLNVLPIHVPPLRERPEDMRPLVEHFLQKHRGLHPQGRVEAGAEFIEGLRQLDLTGNAREVENLVRQALVHSTGCETLQLNCFPTEVLSKLSERAQFTEEKSDASTASTGDQGTTEPTALVTCMASLLDRHGDLSHSMNECERLLVEAALRRTRGNQSRAARLLGITPRSVFNKLRKLREQ
jgi:transcriptional regulator with GAF, ATPase, and Fis domain